MQSLLSQCHAVDKVSVEFMTNYFPQAAWGGGVLFSEKHRHLLKGIERW